MVLETIQLDYPDIDNSFYKHASGYHIPKDTIYVYGANTAGRPWSIGSKTAMLEYGGVLGEFGCISGRSYGVPVKDRNNLRLSIKDIESGIYEFLELMYTKHPRTFFVDSLGSYLYPDEQIVPFFLGSKQCWFPDDWYGYLESDLPW